MNSIYYGYFDVYGLTQLSKILVARSRKGVCLIELLEQGRTDIPVCPTELETRLKQKAIKDNTAINDIRDALTGYFAQRINFFDIPVDLSIGTQFQQRVWRKLRDISYGNVRSYKWVAEGIGLPKGLRAVGQACASNPVPIIIPCHRVIRADGSLGGYSSGLALKKQLLKLEGFLR